MKSIRSIVRPVAVALVLALSAAPATAFAGNKDPAGETKKAKHFPMAADSFNKHIEKRITKMRERIAEKLATYKVSEAMQAQIKKDLEAGAVTIRAAAARVGADGTVTQAEAKEVRTVAKGVKRQAREKFMPGKGKRPGKKSDDVG